MSGATILEVEGLRVATSTHPSLELVRGFDLQVREGETVGLVGESGSGKSLTLRAICGLLPDGVRRSSGLAHMIGPGGSTVDAPTQLGRGIAMVFQEPMISLNPTMRIGDLVTIGPRSQGLLTRARAHERAIELMHEVGIADPERRSRAWPHELSGGLRQRVMIAMALATEPRILLCDEPTTALDVSVQDQILRLLLGLKESRGLAMVLVTHDLAVVSQVCDRIVVMNQGLIVEQGETDRVLHDPTDEYTRRLIEAVS